MPPEEEGHDPLEARPEWADVIYCVAFNEDKKPLREAARLLKASPPDKPIYIWGAPTKVKHGLWRHGVDCRAQAIQIWHVKAQGYVILDLDYALPWYKRIQIRSLLKGMAEKSVKTAF